MRCTVIASGSKGNCFLVEGSGGSLLVDAGLSAKEILKRLAGAGKDPGLIRAILVTHEHGDHIGGVDVLTRRLNIPAYATPGTVDNLPPSCNKSRDSGFFRKCTCNNEFPIGDFSIEPFATSHDAGEPCGFVLREDGMRLGICTDTGIITGTMMEHLLRCDGIVLESNHCPVMLKEGPYPESLKRRIRSETGHLSNPAAEACLQQLGHNAPVLVLAHLSEINNTPEKAMACARNGLGLLFDQTTVIVASQKGTSQKSPQEFSL